MILGRVNEKFPRVVLSVAGKDETVNIEFIVDTGFDGGLSLPLKIVRLLDATFLGDLTIMLADGTPRPGA